MADGKVVKRAKYKTSLKAPGVPGVLKLVLFSFPARFDYLYVTLWLRCMIVSYAQIWKKKSAIIMKTTANSV